MDFDAEQFMLRELDSGERLLWAGQPDGGVRLRRADWTMIPFSLMWGGFAVFWEVGVIRTHAPMFFRLWGIPFVAVGAYLVLGRFFHDAWRRRHTLYGVTDRRILIVSGASRRSMTSFALRTLSALTLSEQANGMGDVVLDASDGRHVATGGVVPRGSSVPPMLEFLRDARHVYDVVRQAQQRLV